MPSFNTTVTIEQDVEIDFEVYCGRCGAGICNNSTVGKTTRRGYPYVTIDPCEKCIENAKDEALAEQSESHRDEIDLLNDKIRELESELREERG